MKAHRTLPCLLALVLAAPPAVAADEPAATLRPDAPPRVERRDPVTYDVELRAVVTAPYKTKVLRVWMPVPPDDAGQERLGDSSFETWPMQVEPRIAAEPLYGNRFAYFEFHNPKGAQMIAHRFRIRVWELHWNLDPAQVQRVEAWPDTFAPYLRSEEQAVVISDEVREMAQRIVPQPDSPAADAGRIMAWIDGNMSYDHAESSRQASSLWAMERRIGHCSDYHGLCSAFSRALSFPARVTYGINPFPKESPSHCKAELFLPPYGWVSFDLSETQRLCAAIAADSTLDAGTRESLIAAARQRLSSGFRDNTWFVQTRGTDYDLAPPAARRVAVVRTIYAEADGEALAEPDPADKTRREFSWMTLHQYQADRKVPYPFKDWSTLAIDRRPQ